jgi:hypothetical protein
MLPINIPEFFRFNIKRIASIWIDKVRHSSILKRHNELSDEQLESMVKDVSETLIHWLGDDTDRVTLGAFFVKVGKDRLKQGFAISEVIYSLSLLQRAVIEFLDGNILENSMELYRGLEITVAISEFFMLATFYFTKGFLEDAYLGMNKEARLSDEMLRRFFKDDFFFKDSGH